MEEWRDIENYEGIYQVSNCGRVKNIKTGRIRKLHKGVWGYMLVILTKNYEQKNIPIHRLVANAFIPKVDGKTEVNHIDGNKENNNVSNLEWCSKSENIRHAFKIGLKDYRGSKSPSARKVIDTRTGKIYGTVKECAKENGLSTTQLGRMLHKLIVSPFNYY